MVAQEKQIHWQKNVDADKQLDTDVSGIRHSFSKKKRKLLHLCPICMWLERNIY